MVLKTCPRCFGTGRILLEKSVFGIFFDVMTGNDDYTCPLCHGTGYIDEAGPPVFIDKTHVGDTKIAGRDIIDGIKITGDTGMIKITSRGSTEKPFSKCPYCGEVLNLHRTPKYCPYCGEQLR